jgi:hypothetical protein
MTDDLDRLTEQWILTFCEAPVLVDPELMRRVLADYEQDLKEKRKTAEAALPTAARSGRRRGRQAARSDGEYADPRPCSPPSMRPARGLIFRGDKPCDP